MPRAKRHYIPNGRYVWHITHRCHKKEFLLKFSKDKLAWMKWLHRAKKAYHLRILDYVITSNHIHLLVLDDAPPGMIAKAMHLVAGATAQQYNRRKKRCGSFWQDRYHATAVDRGQYLRRCLAYIDLNAVRAGIVQHPDRWPYGGYAEIMKKKIRYRLIDVDKLKTLLGLNSSSQHLQLRREWVEERMRQAGLLKREAIWTESVAAGSREFTEKLKAELGAKGIGKTIDEQEGVFKLRENETSYFRAEKRSVRLQKGSGT